MKKDDLRKLVRNPKFISGIYNYCDRWCERCRFTAYCRVYDTEQRRLELADTCLQRPLAR